MAALQNVLVTGATRGIGLAITSFLAQAGYRVLGTARGNSEALEAASRAARESGRGQIEFRACDLSDIARIGPFVRALRAEFGPLYGLVNNAGIGTHGVLGTMRDADIEGLVHINVLAPLVLTKYAVRSMMAERSGRIVSISSIVAQTGFRGLSAYSATKASLLGLTRSLAREVGELGITVNAIAPGFLDTAMTESLSGSQREQIAKRSALRRTPEAIDVARSVEFLLGEGGRNITGTVLTVDAGNTA